MMRRAIFTAIVGTSLAWVPPARADIAPSPDHGYRFIDRSLIFDWVEWPDGEARTFSAIVDQRRHPIDSTEVLQDLATSVELCGGRSEAGTGCKAAVTLDTPPQQETRTANDRRVRMERHYRVIWRESLEVTAVEDLFFDEAGEILCRRPPLAANDVEFDPCDPTSAERKRAHYTEIAAIVGTPLLLAATLFFVWRRRRSSRAATGAGRSKTDAS